jgi:hypothetical protein
MRYRARVAIQRWMVLIVLKRFGECFGGDAELFHPAADPDDQSVAGFAISDFSLHGQAFLVVVVLCSMPAARKRKACGGGLKPYRGRYGCVVEVVTRNPNCSSRTETSCSYRTPCCGNQAETASEAISLVSATLSGLRGAFFAGAFFVAGFFATAFLSAAFFAGAD